MPITWEKPETAEPTINWSGPDVAISDAAMEAGKKRGRVVEMPYEDFLRLAPELKTDPGTDRKGRSLATSLDSGEAINELPRLVVKDGKVDFSDGRHRAIAIGKVRGTVPVVIEGDLAGVKDLTAQDSKDRIALAKWGIAEPSTTAERVLTGVMDPIHGGVQLLEKAVGAVAPGAVKAVNTFNNWLAAQGVPGIAALPAGGVSEATRERERTYEAQRAAAGSEGFDAARIAGAVASPANIALAALGGPATTLGSRALTGAATGAAMGAATPVAGEDFWTEKAKQVALGAGVGAAVPAVTAGAARVVRPAGNPEAAALAAEGIRATPGQIVGGAAKTTEEKLRSVPVLGDAIAAAQRRGIEDFNRATYRRALANLGPKAEKMAATLPVGNNGVRAVGDALSSAYESALERSVPSVVYEQAAAAGTKGVPSVPNAFLKALGNLDRMVPTAMREDFRNVLKANIFDRVSQGGTLTPSVAKEAESELGRLAAEYMGSSVASERVLGKAIRQTQAELRDLVARSNPDIAPEIQRINAGWADLVQIENAAGMLGAKNGIFTPSQYLNAIKRGDKSVRDRRFTRNEVANVKFARTADNVLSQRYPDSGTAGRSLLALLTGGAVGGHFAPLETMATIGALGASALPYTQPGNALMRMALTQRPQAANALADLVRRAGQYVAPGAISAVQPSQQP